ncbi:hypothetical protein [Rhodoplanes azumiensis]|uniref:Uncharacterized protein n=1 Tax=Rhodoplanes azumiensis TaxID=1897628 RepID=A0ABW5AQV1_9BRAD
MKGYVVDENVAIVANDQSSGKPRAPQANTACRLACIKKIREIVKGRLVFIDSNGAMLNHYKKHLSRKGQTGVGDLFFKHLCDNEFNRKKIRRIDLERLDDGAYAALSIYPSLLKFDPADQIFVAVALTAPEKPAIINAVDSDYKQFASALLNAGVVVEELCEDCIKTLPSKQRG